jgi:hypothetical protein
MATRREDLVLADFALRHRGRHPQQADRRGAAPEKSFFGRRWQFDIVKTQD